MENVITADAGMYHSMAVQKDGHFGYGDRTTMVSLATALKSKEIRPYRLWEGVDSVAAGS